MILIANPPQEKRARLVSVCKKALQLLLDFFFALGEAFASRKKVIKSSTKWAFNYCLFGRKQTED